MSDDGDLQCLRLSGESNCINYQYNYVQDFSFFDSQLGEGKHGK